MPDTPAARQVARTLNELGAPLLDGLQQTWNLGRNVLIIAGCHDDDIIALLRGVLPRLQPANAQAELYLTDVVHMTLDDGDPVAAHVAADPEVMLAINSRVELAAVNALMRQARPCRTAAQLKAAEAASGRPVGTFGVGSVGSGLVDAVTAISGLAACLPGAPTIGQPTPGNGADAVPRPRTANPRR